MSVYIFPDLGHVLGEVPLYTGKQEYKNKRRILMLYSVAVGIVVVFVSVLLSINLVQGLRFVQNRYRQTMQAAYRANLAASEIQKLLANRPLRCKGWQ